MESSFGKMPTTSARRLTSFYPVSESVTRMGIPESA
jgi:hypothetical protein